MARPSHLAALAAAALALMGCAATIAAGPSRAAADPAACFELFAELDRIERLYPSYRRGVLGDDRGFVQAPRLSRQVERVRRAQCTTDLTDLAPMDALAAELAPFRRVAGGGPAETTALQVGIVTGLGAEIRAATFFGNLGYRYRSTGVEGLGRRVYVGPIRSQAEMDQAVDVARRGGFLAPYPARWVKF